MNRTSRNATELSGIELFQYYYTPVLVCLGCVGNSISAYVFFSTKLKKLSSSYYLAGLAISDTGFLIALFIVWLNMIEVDLFNQDGACQLIIYSTGVCSFLSVWLVVAFTVERFVAVRYPLLRQSVCTVRRARMILLILVTTAVALFTPLLIFASPQPMPHSIEDLCGIDPRWQDMAGIFNAFDTIITFVVPALTIIVLNTYISRTVWTLNSARKRMTSCRGASRGLATQLRVRKGTMLLNKDRRQHARCSPQNKVTKMLLVVSSVFLGLNMPSYVMRVMAYLLESHMMQADSVDMTLFLNMQHISLQFFNTSFGINFVLYCVSGQNFRKIVRSMLCPTRLKRTETAALTRQLLRNKSVSDSRTQSSGSSGTSRRKKQTGDAQELIAMKKCCSPNDV